MLARPAHPKGFTMRRSPLLAIAATAALFLTACGSDSPTTTTDTSSQAPAPDGTTGTKVDVGDGQAWTFATLDSEGNPASIGIRFTEAALDNLPESMGENHMPTSWPLPLPDAAADTAFRYVTLDWNAHGHEPPGIFDKPHFDMHFYFLDKAGVEAINPADPDFAAKAGNVPDAAHVPAGFGRAPGPAEEQGVPLMGVHWLNGSDGIGQGPFDFTEVMIMGSWDGQWTFVEPMMTTAWLREKPTVREDLAQPEAYPRDAYYPTSYSVEFEESTGEYVITLGGMEAREAG